MKKIFIEKIECQKCGWIGTYADLIAPTSDHEPSCPDCLGDDFLDVEDNLQPVINPDSKKPSEGGTMDKPINIIFDGPPSRKPGRFVEVETDDGRSINVGEWIERNDGLWALRITELPKK